VSWRDKLPELPRGWYWLRYDPCRHLVLLRCVHGMWAWLDPDGLVKVPAEAVDAIHRGLEAAVERGMVGEVMPQLAQFYLQRDASPPRIAWRCDVLSWPVSHTSTRITWRAMRGLSLGVADAPSWSQATGRMVVW
jgi:hypothetical protein